MDDTYYKVFLPIDFFLRIRSMVIFGGHHASLDGFSAASATRTAGSSREKTDGSSTGSSGCDDAVTLLQHTSRMTSLRDEGHGGT